jgi:hypothetical protein
MTQTHIALINLQSQIHAAQQQEHDLRTEREVCDMEFRAMNAHLGRISIRPRDLEDYEAVLRRRERVSDEWRVASRRLIGLQRRLSDAGLQQ